MAIKTTSMDIQTKENISNKHSKVQKMPINIQIILNVIEKRKISLNYQESNRLNLQMSFLKGGNLKEVYLEGTNLTDADLEEANLKMLV